MIARCFATNRITAIDDFETELDWSDYPGAGGGFRAPSRCATTTANAASRSAARCARATASPAMSATSRADVPTRCASRFPASLARTHLHSDEMQETMKLCVSCKACKRECPTGVDMARMKIEVLAAANKRNGLSLRDRLIGYLPRYAPYASALAPMMNMPNWLPGFAGLMERLTGISAKRPLPSWRWGGFSDRQSNDVPSPEADRAVVLFGDTFNRYFEPGNIDAASSVLEKLGYAVTVLRPSAGDSKRPLCCGRTFLAAGLVDEARKEARRMLSAVKPYVETRIPIVGLEPSCLFSLRDEFGAMLPGEETARLADNAFLFEEFLVREADAGRIETPFATHQGKLMLHGHCHQKAFGTMGAVTGALAFVEGLETSVIESSCCGMAGSFGYQPETYDESMQMAELSLLPAVREADAEILLAADGFSCRHQIKDGAGREARHVARILDDLIPEPRP